MKQPRGDLVSFRRHLRVETVPAEAVYLISERDVTALSGPWAERLAPLLDGTRSIADLTQELSAELAEAEVRSAIEQMRDAGLLDLSGPARPGPAPDAASMAFWAMADQAADESAALIGSACAEVVAVGGANMAALAQAMCAACAESGLASGIAGVAGATVSVVLCEDYLDPRLDEINTRHLATGRPWLLARPAGAEAWIGPVFQPGAGPCWACLAVRLRGSRDEAHLLRRLCGDRAFPAAPQASLPASRAAALRLTALELTKWLASRPDQRQQGAAGQLYILDMLSLRGGHHPVQRRPQCPSCGAPEMMAARGSRPPAVNRAGAGPGLDLANYGHLIDPVTGIVADLRRDERCPEFQRVYLSGRNRAQAASTMAGLRVAALHPNGGRGVTEEEAKASALGEAIERYCGTRQGDEPVVRGSLRGLGPQAIHPNACFLFDQRQFAERTRWNAACMPFHRVPEPFDETAVTDWTPVWSLLDDGRRLLPTTMVYYQPTAEHRPASAPADSNGNAAGASLEDAIVRGFLELVERDAVALWWYNRTRQPGVCLRSFGDSWLAGLPAAYRRLGREIWVLDVTSDLGIPVMAAISRRTGGAAGDAAGDTVCGFGAHADPRIALRRAATELGQLLPAAGAAVPSQAYLLPQPDLAPRAAADYGRAPRLDLDGICAIARRAGLDVLVIDQTRPDIGIPVARVVVPGLRHFWPRFAPGRLFDVPVRLNRLQRPTGYAELNPMPIHV